MDSKRSLTSDNRKCPKCDASLVINAVGEPLYCLSGHVLPMFKRNLEGLSIKCIECGTGKTPQWRQYQDGIYCNACGIKKYRKGLKKKNRGKK